MTAKPADVRGPMPDKTLTVRRKPGRAQVPPALIGVLVALALAALAWLLLVVTR